MNNYRVCNKCGWCHYSITRQEAEDHIAEFNAYYRSASKSTKDQWSGEASIEQYEKCFRCENPYSNFEWADDDEVPTGSTVQPIIVD